MASFRLWSWQSGALLGLALGAAIALSFGTNQKRVFLPGKTSAGHHQIESACGACHEPFAGVGNGACNDCHAADLAAAKDSHGPAKFRDPRTADMLAAIDATRCVTCHKEHVPQLTRSMSVSVPADFCHECHADIATERPSHEAFPANGCAATGCHRYHDNTALYEDFLAGRLEEPDTKDGARRPLRDLAAFFTALEPARRRPLTAAEHDGKPGTAAESKLMADWAGSAHARGGVNCRDCHQIGSQGWTDRPGLEPCKRCHGPETSGFLSGRHGMRLEQGLSPMTPGAAQLPMKARAAKKELGCGSCHDAHAFDTRKAAVEACLSCHDDQHSKNYTGSPHHVLWQKELRGELPPGSGVSCAGCHLPRTTRVDHGRQRIAVEHNQNANLRPDDKFVRSVCIDCHGVLFALNALADEDGVRKNFAAAPKTKLDTIDMVRQRAAAKR